MTEPLEIIDGIPVFRERDEFTDNYDLIAEDYLSHIDETGMNPWQTDEQLDFMQTPTVKAIMRHSKPGEKILDVGVSTGRLLKEVTGRELHGIDISIECLLRAREHGIEVACASAESLPYPDESFHLVVCTDVLEHVKDLNATIREIQRVLLPGGYLVVRVPREESLNPYLSPDCPYRFIHLRTFDPAVLTMLLTLVFPFTRVSFKSLNTEGSKEMLMVVRK